MLARAGLGARGLGSLRDEAESIFKHYVAAGGNFFCTADVYTNGSSEKILGELLRPLRRKAVLAAKFPLNTSPGDPNAGGNRRNNMGQALEGSLKRLGTAFTGFMPGIA